MKNIIIYIIFFIAGFIVSIIILNNNELFLNKIKSTHQPNADEIKMIERENVCNEYLRQTILDFKFGNLVYYTSEYIPHLDELLFNNLGIILSHRTEDKIYCGKQLMDSIIYYKFGKTAILSLIKKAKEINQGLPSYLTIDSAYTVADIEPEFPGGNEMLDKYLNEPKRADPDKYVIILMNIETNGSLTHIKIYRKLNPKADSLSIQLVKRMPKWKPAIYNGKYVRFRKELWVFW